MSRIFQSIFNIVSENMDENGTTGDRSTTEQGNKAKTCSLIEDLKARQHSGNDGDKSRASSNDLAYILRQRYKKRGILVSYDVEGNFSLKQLVKKTVQELKEIGFEDDIWFDKDESNPLTSWSFVQRLEASEECNAAIVFLSENYFFTGPSKYEADVFIERDKSDDINPNGYQFRLFVIKCDVANTEFEMFSVDVDLTSRLLSRSSVAEKASAIVGTLSGQLETCVTFTTKLYRELSEADDNFEHSGYKEKSVHEWNIHDVQEWLASLGVHERYRVSFEESAVDGFLLESLREDDMVEYLNVDSKLARQKVLQNLKRVVDKGKGTSLDECCRTRKTRDNSVYLVCDPTDVWIAEFIKSDLMKIGVIAYTHESFSSSKSSCQPSSNTRHLTEAATAIFVMSASTENSYFAYKELLFTAWLDKPIITAVFKNSWNAARYSLKAILSKKPAISFARNLYLDGLEVLRYHVKPDRCKPRVVLQRQYIHKMLDGVKPLERLLSKKTGLEVNPEAERPKVFLSYHWDMQGKAVKIKEFLVRQGLKAFTDTSRAIAVSLATPREYRKFGSQARSTTDAGALVQEQISYSTVVVLCITMKYLHSDNFIKDSQLAQLHKKPVIPIMLQWCPRPLERVATVAKKLEMTSGLIDMSSEQMFRKNLPELVHVIMKTSNNR